MSSLSHFHYLQAVSSLCAPNLNLRDLIEGGREQEEDVMIEEPEQSMLTAEVGAPAQILEDQELEAALAAKPKTEKKKEADDVTKAKLECRTKVIDAV